MEDHRELQFSYHFAPPREYAQIKDLSSKPKSHPLPELVVQYFEFSPITNRAISFNRFDDRNTLLLPDITTALSFEP